MKRLLLMIASALLIATGTTNTAIASGQGDAITNFQVAMSINPDSTMEVSEGITYSFNVPGHGIWRAIPLLDNLPNNKQQVYNVQLLEVLQDNAPAQYETSQDDEFLYVKIGNPDQEVTGEHTYVITYSVGGALRKLADNQVDFYWDVIGDQWDVPILSATADIWLPGKYLSTNCTFGPAGSLTKCSDTNEPDALHYTVDGLLTYEAMTVATQLPADAFTSFTEPTIRNAPDPWGDFTKSLPIGAGIGVALAAAIVIWARKRRANTVTAPIHEFVRFEIPRNLRPAEINAGWQGKVDGRAFTATLLDLAARGIITLQLDKHDDIVITRADPTREMAAWESTLLNSILDGKMTLTLKGYIKNVGEAVSIIDGDLVTRAESTGIRNAKAWQPRIPLIIGTAVLALSVAGLAAGRR